MQQILASFSASISELKKNTTALLSERIPVNTVQLMDIFHAHDGGHGNQTADTEQSAGHQGGGMSMIMSMAHLIHLHGQSFHIVSRTVGAGTEDDYASVSEGFIESGLKDTVLVMPGESVRIIKPFQDFKGLFMFHCHNLEHEDMGMMWKFLVE